MSEFTLKTSEDAAFTAACQILSDIDSRSRSSILNAHLSRSFLAKTFLDVSDLLGAADKIQEAIKRSGLDGKELTIISPLYDLLISSRALANNNHDSEIPEVLSVDKFKDALDNGPQRSNPFSNNTEALALSYKIYLFSWHTNKTHNEMLNSLMHLKNLLPDLTDSTNQNINDH